MGLDATIKRADGKPLGTVAEVEKILAVAFPGVVFDRLPSGAEKIQAAKQKGIEFPEILRKHFEAAPAQHGAEFNGPDFSAQFSLGPSDVVQEIDVTLRGKTTASERNLAVLEKRFGWITTYP